MSLCVLTCLSAVACRLLQGEGGQTAGGAQQLVYRVIYSSGERREDQQAGSIVV